MCCKADKKLTKRYQKRKRRFSAWKVWRRGSRSLFSNRHHARPGGRVTEPGRIVSSRARKRWRKDKKDLVYAGIHWFVSREVAEEEAKRMRYHGHCTVAVRVMVDPADVVAVGDLWFNDGRSELTDGLGQTFRVGVSTAVELLPKDWKKATG